MPTLTYNQGAELPDTGLVWTDRTGSLIDFSGGTYTFSAFVIRAGTTTQLTNAVGTGAAGSLSTTPPTPNLVMSWAAADIAALTVDVDYRLVVRARRVSDSKDRDFPGPLTLHIRSVP